MKDDSIQEYILETAKNLRLAEAISIAWPKARHQIVSQFLDRIGNKLISQLPGWNYAIDGHFFDEPNPGFYLFKPSWKGQYSIALQCHNSGQRICFGVLRQENIPTVKKHPFCPELLAAVKAHHPSAISRNWWEAQIKMRSPAPDWSDSEVLWRIHQDDSFFDDVLVQLLNLAKISETYISQLTGKP